MSSNASLQCRSQDSSLVELWLDLKVSPHTQRAYAREAARFLEFLGCPLIEAKLPDLTRFRDHLGQGSLALASQNRALTAVKSLLSFAHQSGYLPYNIGIALKLRPQRSTLAQRILSEDDVARLIQAAPQGRDRLLLRFLYITGARVSEACAMRWCHVSERGGAGQVSLYGKGGKTRQVLLPERIWKELAQIRDGATSDAPVFASRKGAGPLDASQIRRIVYRAALDSGLDKAVSPHWLRHAHASHALDRNSPIHLVQATLGHASISTTGRYLHARPAESSSLYLPD